MATANQIYATRTRVTTPRATYGKAFTYANGRTVSVINTGYGGNAGLYEIGFVNADGSINNVKGWLRWGQVCHILKQVKGGKISW